MAATTPPLTRRRPPERAPELASIVGSLEPLNASLAGRPVAKVAPSSETVQDGSDDMNRAVLFTCIGLIAVVVAFVAAWISLPSDSSRRVSPPASLFARGLASSTYYAPTRPTPRCQDSGCRGEPPGLPQPSGPLLPGTPAHTEYNVNLPQLKQRIEVFFGGAAAVVLLLGIGLGAAAGRLARA